MTGYLILTAAVLALGGGVWWWMKTHPYGKCRWCRGSGKSPLSTKARYGTCKHCEGSGRKEWKV